MYKFLKRIIAALWAFQHVDDLTMLKHNLKTDSEPDVTRREGPLNVLGFHKEVRVRSCAAERARWYHQRYLSTFPLD